MEEYRKYLNSITRHRIYLEDVGWRYEIGNDQYGYLWVKECILLSNGFHYKTYHIKSFIEFITNKNNKKVWKI